MLPITVKIQGDYWDIQLYKGRLYLWKTDGSLIVLQWEQMISELFGGIDEYLIRSAFVDGRYLYGKYVKPIVSDIDIQKIIKIRFSKISKLNLTIEERDLEKYKISTQDNPFRDLQSDTEIFNSKIYACTSNGILYSTAHNPNLSKAVSTKPRKIWDGRAIEVTANDYGRMTISAASDGLFEFSESLTSRLQVLINGNFIEDNIYQVSKKPSTFANWNYFSIYNTSLSGDSGLAKYSWHKNKANETYTKTFESYLDESLLFGNEVEEAISWGCDEKIYRATLGKLEIVDYSNPYDNEAKQLGVVKTINIDPWKGRFLSAGSAPFGAIIEYENAVVVIRSDEIIETIKGETARWRVYPRSKNYLNQLHIIQNDYIEIRSYNHDPFLDQDAKKIGNKFIDRGI